MNNEIIVCPRSLLQHGAISARAAAGPFSPGTTRTGNSDRRMNCIPVLVLAKLSGNRLIMNDKGVKLISQQDIRKIFQPFPIFFS